MIDDSPPPRPSEYPDSQQNPTGDHPLEQSGPLGQSGGHPRAPISAPYAGPERSAGLTSRLLIVLVVLALVLVLPLLVERVQYAITRGQQQAKADVAKIQLAKFSDTADTFRFVAQSVEPSVVHIDTEQLTAQQRVQTEDEFTFLLPRRRSKGQGSGVIISDEGYIVTNFHVIAGASKVTVNLSDGRSIESAKIVGYDPLTDLAVIKIDADNLTSAPWGDSESLDVGDWVLAVGSPFGLDHSVTAGIISAKGRRGVVGDNPYQNFLQTDAAVNPGNSGGPLVNLSGEVVGINTAIVGSSYQGISFAIPSEIARDVVDRLQKEGRVSRGWLGVALQTLSEELAERLGYDSTDGALIAGVIQESPAEKAGLRKDDILVEWNGTSIDDPSMLTLLVAQTDPGTEAELVVVRRGKRIKLRVTTGERPPLAVR